MAGEFGQTGGLSELLLSLLSGGGGGGGGDILQFLRQGSKSPLLKEILNATLAALVPGERQARQSLTDQFRAAGGLRSGAYGRESTLLEGELAGKRGLATAGVMGSTLGPILSALMGQQGRQFDLLKLLAGQQSGGGSDPWANIPPSLGLQTPMTPSSPAAPTSPAKGQPINLDQLLQALMGGQTGISPTYPDAGGIAASFPGSESFDLFE